MAIYLEYVKVSESETEVEYRFGGAEDPQGHTVSIHRTDPARTVLPAGISEALTGRVIGRVLRSVSPEGAWPDRGLIQS